MGDVTDPWARKKKTKCWSRNKSNDGKQRGRSTSNSSSSSSNSKERIRRAAASSGSSRVQRKSCTPSVTKVDRRLSPPRGDITGYRIPKRRRSSVSRERSARSARTNSEIKRNSACSRKSDKSDSVKNNAHRRIPDDEALGGINNRGAQNISDSESAHSVSRSPSVVSSSSSSSSPNRSPSPSLPAKYRVLGNRGNAPISLDRNISSMSDSDEKDKVRSRNKGLSRGKKKSPSPHLRAVSPSPSPPPPPPPVDEGVDRLRSREKSESPPPPPPPLPVNNEVVVDRQARKLRESEIRSSEGRSKIDRSPPKKKTKRNSEIKCLSKLGSFS
ncbi:hypothetical protein KIN20_004372 [Parelaphostrongylus tenuis]|uniref:Uncharacterized protein n=1 Tax=Parelaphostrongylus tenuis TaxID=148309 RepID=A0AAD5M305_PARTN|nr:hypothetical protein KIN20_004372 [Parelaphostrongylus tenuis]